MRKMFCFFVFILMTGMVFAGVKETSADPSSARIILYTYYWLIGEGDDIQIGSIDEDGVIRTFSGRFSESGWDEMDRLAYLTDPDRFTVEGTLDFEELFAIKSLIFSAEDQGRKPLGAAEDAGTEESYAIRYSKEGDPEFILLGISGESVFENTDPNAQALYLRLRKVFPGVISFAYDPYMGPAGFVPVPFSDFTGLDINAVEKAEIRSVLVDSEEGIIPLYLTDKAKEDLLSLVRSGRVTGKADCIASTGGVTSYAIYGPDEKLIGTVDLEDGLLVMNDGRYYVDVPEN